MSASPLSFLRAGPPPPKVALLPDGLFFSRAVPITPGATAAEAAAQVELALESMSPFPLAQLYHGWYWIPGAEHAFAYAAYRRRFTVEQTETWGEAELVLPLSAALFGGTVAPATTLVLTQAEGITAVHWDAPTVPSRVVFQPLAAEATEDDRARARDELLRGLGGSKAVVDLLVPPAPEPARSDQEMVFRAGDFISRLSAAVASNLDVRDKAELASLRAARRRDVLLWRVVIGCAAALVLMLVLEFALVAGNGWQKIRVTKLNARTPAVEQIRQADELARSIENLVTKRRLPLEMVTAIVGTNAERKPNDITLTRIQTAPPPALYTLWVEAQTTNPAQITVYQSALEKLPEVQEARVENLQSQAGRSTFRLVVTFKPDALKPDTA